MTDHEVLTAVISHLDPSSGCLHPVMRNGHVLLGLPGDSEASGRTLGLYQPQRFAARAMVSILRGLSAAGLHRVFLSKTRITGGPAALNPAIPGIEPGSCGILLGSPEHTTRRAIACYRNAGDWEVAKISFGEAGLRILEKESEALRQLQPHAPGVPGLLGLHRAEGVTVLRMPYVSGHPIAPGAPTDALELLTCWIGKHAPKPVTEFPEWPDIESALSGSDAGSHRLKQLAGECLRPVVCHGDFARWNLLRKPDGKLVVLDWEWGHQGGLPGVDLVHYILQDARLVKRMTPGDAILATRDALDSPACRSYLKTTGWSNDPLLTILACLAYKQGAGHQDNLKMLAAGLQLKP
ncbi:MAG: phosphotransferase [Verrucomicrobiota bacterium]